MYPLALQTTRSQRECNSPRLWRSRSSSLKCQQTVIVTAHQSESPLGHTIMSTKRQQLGQPWARKPCRKSANKLTAGPQAMEETHSSKQSSSNLQRIKCHLPCSILLPTNTSDSICEWTELWLMWFAYTYLKWLKSITLKNKHTNRIKRQHTYV